MGGQGVRRADGSFFRLSAWCAGPVQELRGNIRVFCRCRPPSEREIANEDGSAIVVTFPNEGEVRPHRHSLCFDPYGLQTRPRLSWDLVKVTLEVS